MEGESNFILTVDHASSRIPRRLGDLGLPASELQRHVAWDIGALGVARLVAKALRAPLVAQNYSRLVIDCNREPGSESSIPKLAEWVAVPGNVDLSDIEIRARRAEIFDPYHSYIGALFDEKLAARRPVILVAMHTMTDVFKGTRRDMHAAVLYGHDARFAVLVLDALRRDKDLLIAENEPYLVQGTHYTIPRHAEIRRVPYVEIEIRQDLVNNERGQALWAPRIAAALCSAERALFADPQVL
jgi:predicted N-formylglutamate amidohydrolase